MNKLLLEAEISKLTFAPASLHWHRAVIDIIVLHNVEVIITFETTQGTCYIHSYIISIIENYVKIKGEVIIPLNSIVNIRPVEPNKADTNSHGRQVAFILIAVVVIFLIFLFIIFSWRGLLW